MFHVEQNQTHLKECPICNNQNHHQFLRCKDNTVSKKEFEIVECDNCGLRFTNPRPKEENLGEYYKSEDYISHSNTTKGLINKVYQAVRKYTLKKKVKLLNELHPRGSILDIGCGTGEFLHQCKLDGWNSIGIEPGEAARNYAINNYKLEVKTENEISQLGKESFDAISLWHVLEHVPHLHNRIKEIKQLLKPEGVLIIAVPNCSSLDAEHYQEHWAAYDVPRHLYHFRPENIRALLLSHGFREENILPMLFDSFYVSILSEQYKNGTSNLLSAFWVGLKSNINAKKTGKTYSSQIYIYRKN